MQLFFVILHDAVPATPEGREALSNKLVSKLKLDNAAVEQIFKKLPVIIRRNISQADAEKYVQLLESLGASAEALPEVELASNVEDPDPEQRNEETASATSLTPPPTADTDDLSLNISESEEQEYEQPDFGLPETPNLDEEDYSLDFSDERESADPFSDREQTPDPFADDSGPSFEDESENNPELSFPTDDQPFDLDTGGLSFTDSVPDALATDQYPSEDGTEVEAGVAQVRSGQSDSDAATAPEGDPLDFSIPFTGDPPPPEEIWDQGVSEHAQLEGSTSLAADSAGSVADSKGPDFEYSDSASSEQTATASEFREPEDSKPASDMEFSSISELQQKPDVAGTGSLTSAVSDAAFGSSSGTDELDSDESRESASELHDVNIADELANVDEEQGVPLVKLVGGFIMAGAGLLITLNVIFPGPDEEMDAVAPKVDPAKIQSMLKAQEEILSKEPDPDEAGEPKEDVIADWSGELQENGVYTRVSLVTVNGTVAGMAIEIKTDDVGPPSDEEVMSGNYQPWLKRFYAKEVAPVAPSETTDGSRGRLKGKGRAYLVYGLTRERAIFEIHVAAPKAQEGEPLEGVWLIEEGDLPEGEENFLRRQGENSYAIRLSGRFSALPVVKTPNGVESTSP